MYYIYIYIYWYSEFSFISNLNMNVFDFSRLKSTLDKKFDFSQRLHVESLTLKYDILWIVEKISEKIIKIFQKIWDFNTEN